MFHRSAGSTTGKCRTSAKPPQATAQIVIPPAPGDKTSRCHPEGHIPAPHRLPHRTASRTTRLPHTLRKRLPPPPSRVHAVFGTTSQFLNATLPASPRRRSSSRGSSTLQSRIRPLYSRPLYSRHHITWRVSAVFTRSSQDTNNAGLRSLPLGNTTAEQHRREANSRQPALQNVSSRRNTGEQIPAGRKDAVREGFVASDFHHRRNL